MTEWADDVGPTNPLPEYPRPQLVRENWVNLNGLWDYAVTRVDDPQPTEFEEQILVPFCIRASAHLVLELPRFRAFSLSSIDHSPRTFD